MSIDLGQVAGSTGRRYPFVRRLVSALAPAPDVPSPDAQTPSRRARLAVAALVGTLSGLLVLYAVLRPGAVPDFLYPWTATRLFLDGTNPYAAMRGGGDPPYDQYFFYPFTALLALIPLAKLSLPAAASVFFGLSSGVLAYLITRDGLWRVHVFMSAPFVVAALLVQFSPLLMSIAFVPALGFLATLKPNLGLAMFAYRPSWKIVIGCAVLGAVSLLIFPSWPVWWLQSIEHDGRIGVHRIPLRETGGVLLLLALLRWRLRAGRLLLVMSVLPQALYFYDQLPLWLIPHTRRESIALTACSQLAMILYYVFQTPGDSVVMSAYPYVLALIYLPALVLLLRTSRDPVPGTQVENAAVPT